MSVEGSNRPLPGAARLVSRVGGAVVSLVRAAAFWIAALLPLSYIPLLGAASITFGGFTKLLVLNVLAVLIGHRHGSSADDRDGDGAGEEVPAAD
jgi:hypothetical protein